MNKSKLVVRFDGGVAQEHKLGLRDLGQALSGLERVISIALFSLEKGKLPRPRQRFPSIIQAGQPRKSSYGLETLVILAPAILPIVNGIVSSGISNIIGIWIRGIFLKLAGRDNQAERLFRQVEEHRHLEMLGMQDLLRFLVRHAVGFTAPIYGSCNRIFLEDDEDILEIDRSMADAIRSWGQHEVGELNDIVIRVDGFTHHNRQLKIVFPNEPNRFVTSRVLDPLFRAVPNLYTEAATNQNSLLVDARANFKNGRIVLLEILRAAPLPDRP